MKDRLDDLRFYQMSIDLFNDCWADTELMMHDTRGRELVKQMIRSVGSISANIEEVYGRGSQREYIHFLRIARGSARESKGWYKKSGHLLGIELINDRMQKLDSIIAMLNASIKTLESKKENK